MSSVESALRRLPGSEIVLAGIADLAHERETVDAAAVQDELFRFPAIDAGAFREKLLAALA